MALSADMSLVYVLRPSGVVGRLTSGRVSQHPNGELIVYDAYGRVIEYLSHPGGKIRSWCVVDPTGKPVDGWHQVLEGDRAKVFPLSGSL